MLKRLKYIGSLLLLFVALQAAGQGYVIDSVCVNSERQYRVDGEVKSTYSWILADATGTVLPLANANGTPYAENDPVSGKPIVGTEISIKWLNPGNFTLKVIQVSEFGCDTLEQGKVIVYDQPLADAGKDAIVCPNMSHALSDATASNYSTLLWTSSGDGTFDTPSLLKPTYTPGPQDLVAGKVMLTLRADGMGAGTTCTPAISTMELTILNLTAKLDTTGITCYQADNATIQVKEPLGGQGAYKYSINQGLSWQVSPLFKNLGPGNYFVQMRDTVLQTCVATIDTIAFVEPKPLGVDSLDIKQITCVGNDGSIRLINPKGGFGAFEFSLNETNWQATGQFTGLVPLTTYVVWMRDALYKDCKISLDTIVFKEPDPLMADISHVDVKCYGGIDGSIQLTNPRNGSGTYQYQLIGYPWTTGVTNHSFDKLAAGDYTVLIRDFNSPSCIDTLGVITIKQPAQLTAQVDSTRISCYGANDGRISITNAKGGSGDYWYSIDNGNSWSTNSTLIDLTPGRYDVWIGDHKVADCSEYLGIVWIGEPKQLTGTVASSPITCRDANDGVIRITNAQQGTPPYQYSINNTDWYTLPIFQGVNPGSYVVRIKDLNGCIEELDTLEFKNPEPLMADLKHTNATCLGNDGTIQVLNPLNAVSGTYQFAVSNTLPTASLPLKWQKEGEFKQLPSDTFMIWVRDSLYKTCEIKLGSLIIEAPTPLAAETKTLDVTCFGGSNGSIEVTNPRGGSGRFEYRLLNTSPWSNSRLISTLKMGDYVLEMRDSISPACWITVDTLHIEQPEKLEATPLAMNVSCFGGTDGSIQFNDVKGGMGTPEFTVNGVNWFKNEITGLKANTYPVQMRDSKDTLCIVLLGDQIITEPAKITALVEAEPVTCFGGSDGQLTVQSPANGTAPYRFSRDGGLTWQNDPVFTGLTASTYDIQVKDSKDCIALLDSVTVDQPKQLAATLSATAVTVDGADDGTITVTSYTGGSGDYQFSIDSLSWQTGAMFTGLAPNEYTVWILDAQTVDCVRPYKIKVSPAGTIFFTARIDSVKCYGGSDGRITFTGRLGATRYEHSIDGGVTWSTGTVFSGKPAGTYELAVRNADDITKVSGVRTVQILEPEVIRANIRITSETNPGRKDGSLEVLATSGGSGGFQYRLDNGPWGTVKLFAGLTEGSYTIGIKDKYDCQRDTTVAISAAGSLTLSAVPRDVTCRGGNDGQIFYEKPMGGSGFFQYNNGSGWLDFTGSFTWTKLIAGTYTLQLRDKNDAPNVISIVNTIGQPQPWSVLVTNQPSGTKTNLTATVSGTGGVPPFTYLWSDGQRTQTARNLDFGDYSVIVTDANKCTVTVAYALGFKVTADLIIPILCPGGMATIRIKASEGGNPYRLLLNGKTFTESTWVDVVVPARGAPYTYQVEDGFGIRAWTLPILVTEPKPVTATVTGNPGMCAGSKGEIVIANPTGGTGKPYQYRINGGTWTPLAAGGTATETGLSAGNYTVELQETGSSCPVASWNLTITDPKAITLTASPIHAVCFGDKGSIVFTTTNVPDGTYTLTYSTGTLTGVVIRNNSATVQVPAGTYNNLKLTSGVCSTADGINIQINDGVPMILTADVLDPSCTVSTGTITVKTPLPATGLTYSLRGTIPVVPALTNATGVFTGLAAGVYEVTATNAAGCISNTLTLTIKAPPANLADPVISITQPTCLTATGTIRVTAPVPAPGLTYQLTGIDPVVATVTNTTGVFPGLNAGKYEITTKNVAGCTSNAIPATINVAPPTPATPTALATQPDCLVPSGTITVSMAIPDPTMSYTIRGTNPVLPAVTNLTGVFTGLSKGVYSVTLTNLQGCISLPVSVTINGMPLPPTVPLAKVTVQPTCNNLDGTVQVTSPTAGPYHYTINGITQRSATFAGLKTGIYLVTVKDTLTQCVSTGSINVPAIPPSPVFTALAENSKCFGEPGKITFTATNTADGLYTVKYQGGEFKNVNFKNIPASVPATATATVPAMAGTYSNLNIDVKGCVSDPIPTVVITQPTQIKISNVISTPITLKSPNGGAIELVGVSGGTGPYFFRWESSPDGIAWAPMAGETTQKIMNLRKGEYRVTITDNNGCKVVFGPYLIPAPNYPPEAINDPYTSNCNVVNGNVLDNDTDLENDPMFISTLPVKAPLHGSVELLEDGSFTYRVDPLFAGKDSFVYAHKDFPDVTAKVIIQIISDMDHDGIADGKDPDADGDGILNVREVQGGESYLTTDADVDGLPNYLDIDSDNDGIVDYYEAQPSDKTILPAMLDVNANGVDDAYDSYQFTAEIVPVDTDGDGFPDFLDTDSENDGVPDFIEGNDEDSNGKPDFPRRKKDSDSDGLDDAYDTVPNNCDAFTNFYGSNAPMQDFDGDGRPDYRDENDDDDKYPTKWEDLNGDKDFSNDDTDFDGHPEYLDYGRECDLFIPDAFSPNGDNIHDYYQVFCLDHFPDAHIYIFDQLGNKIFEQEQYGNRDRWITYEKSWWSGKADRGKGYARNELVPPGTYFYVLDLGNGEVKKSFVFVSY